MWFQDVGLARILKREYLTTLQGSAFTFAYAAPEVRYWRIDITTDQHRVRKALSWVRCGRCCWGGSALRQSTAMAWVRALFMAAHRHAGMCPASSPSKAHCASHQLLVRCRHHLLGAGDGAESRRAPPTQDRVRAPHKLVCLR